MRDELTGKSQEHLDHPLEVDHVQAAATATYNSKYLRKGAEDALKQFYNSPDNFQLLSKSANASKGDVRVYSDGNKVISEKRWSKKNTNWPTRSAENTSAKE